MNKVKICYNNNIKSIEVYELIKEKLCKNDFEIVNEDYNIAMAIGGDGSFLRMIKETNFKNDILYIGINTGTLGFAQEVNINEIDELIDNLKKNNYKIEEFGIQETNVYSENTNSKFFSLNEIVIREKELNTVKLNVYIEDNFLESFAGDGLLVSTSFGSTAYNLSFGGPIVYNTFHSLLLTPIAPLNNRSYRNLTNSIVLPQNKQIRLVPKETKNLIITIDGENKIYNNVEKIETVINQKTIKCFRNKEYNFVKKINEKFLN